MDRGRLADARADARRRCAGRSSRKGVDWIAEPVVDRIDAEQVDARDRRRQGINYDYLVDRDRAPKLAFDEVPGLGPDGFTQSICTQEHAAQAWEKYQDIPAESGPDRSSARRPGASCFGPAYEIAMIIDADLRKRKLRDRVPMTYVTSEPYIGHMGLGGVGDSKGLMESELRERHIKWITNAKITRGRRERNDRARNWTRAAPLKKEHELPFAYSDGDSGVQGRRRGRGRARAVQPARLRADRQASAHSEVPEHILGGRLRRDPAGRADAGRDRRAEDRLHDRIDGLRRSAANIAADLAGKPAIAEATWNAICLADFGDTGAAFVALPQIPPRNVTWSKKGKWVHLAKIAFEKYFLRKVRTGSVTPVYETYVLKALGVLSLKGRAGETH